MPTRTQQLVVGSRKYLAAIEYRHDTNGIEEWWVRTDQGYVSSWPTAQDAFDDVIRRALRYNRAVTVTSIEWRNVPEDFVTPKERMR